MLNNIRFLSDRRDQAISPTNLLDEISVKIKAGEMNVTDLIVVYLDEESGELSVHCTNMPRYKAVGLLEYAAALEISANG